MLVKLNCFSTRAAHTAEYSRLNTLVMLSVKIYLVYNCLKFFLNNCTKLYKVSNFPGFKTKLCPRYLLYIIPTLNHGLVLFFRFSSR